VEKKIDLLYVKEEQKVEKKRRKEEPKNCAF